MKFRKEMYAAKSQLEKAGHIAYVPAKEGLDDDSVDYWSEDHNYRAKIKSTHGVVKEHLDKIEKADAVLVVNVTKKEIKNYIGANTFLEAGYAYYRGKKVYVLNPLPDQPYILDELLSFSPTIINGNLKLIK